MESFENKAVIPAKNHTAVIEKPNKDDIFEIAVCMSGFEKDCFGKDIAPVDLIEKAKNKLQNPLFLVIKHSGKVVATAQSLRESETHIAINQVYTLPEYRGNGYASALVAHISNLILEKEKVPALYTDLSNPSSNKAYKNVGFVECGRVDEVTLKW